MDRKINKKRALHVLLTCGSGIATSSLIQPEVEGIIAKLTNNNYILDKGTVYDIPGYSPYARKNIDIVLSTVAVPQNMAGKITVPVVVIFKLLYGSNEDKEEIIKRIKQVLQEIGYSSENNEFK